MTKRISLILLSGLIITLMAMFIMKEPGVAVFNYGETTLEISLTHFYFSAITIFILLYWFFRLLGKISNLPKQLKTQKQNKTRLEILTALENTLIEAALHDWDSAVKTCTRHIKDSPIQKGQYSFIAYCANKVGHIDMRSTHINNLRALEGSTHIANLLEAEFMLDEKKPEKVLALLRDESLEDVNVLTYLCQAYLQIKATTEIEKKPAQVTYTHSKTTQKVSCCI